MAALAAAMTLLPPFARGAVTKSGPQAATLSDLDKADVTRIVDYLNNIHTMTSHFQQIASDGSDTSGTVWIERPGRMRLEYDPPSPILIVADGRGVYYWDNKLEQLSQIGLEDTPAWFLLRPDIKVTGDVTVTRFQRDPGVLQLTMVESDRPEMGSVTLTLADKPLELRQWTVIDAQSRPVTVSLVDPRYGLPINPNQCEFIDPRTGSRHLP